MNQATSAATGALLGETGASMRYGHAVMNIDYVQLQMKRFGVNNWEMIRGATYRSEVKHGALNDVDVYPTYLVGNNVRGSFSRQGIYPYAYASHPYDDFYFTDFITRIHKDDPMDGGMAMIANCPGQARYNDGPYKLKAQLKTVRSSNAYTDSPVQDIYLDNFQPFVEAVYIRIGNNTVYDMEWDCSGSGTCMRPEGGVVVQPPSNPITYADAAQGMRVIVTTSEPMKTFNMSANVLGSQATIRLESTSADRRTFIYLVDLPENNLSYLFQGQGNDVRLRFSGQDYSPTGANGNNLLNLESKFHPDQPSLNTSCVKVPTRNTLAATGTWSNPDNLTASAENAHHFGFNCGSGRSLVEGDGNVTFECCPDISGFSIDIQPDCGSNSGSISVDVSSESGETFTYRWSNGATSSTIAHLAAGTYGVTIINPFCEVTDEIEVPYGADPEFSAEIEQLVPCMCQEEITRAFTLHTSGTLEPFSYSWTGPNGFSSTEQSPEISLYGNYAVTITNAVGCTWERSINIPTCSNNLTADLEVYPSCPGGSTGKIIATPSGDYPPFKILWSNGVTSTLNANIPSGTYSITVTDQHDCAFVTTVEVPSYNTMSLLTPSEFTLCDANGVLIRPEFSNAPAPLNYLWSNGHTYNALFVEPGVHSVTVTNGLGCVQDFTFDVSQGVVPTIVPEITPSPCDEDAGRIKLDVLPGEEAEYSYAWSSGGSSSSIASGLAPGDYTVTVSHSSGCRTIATYTVGSTADAAGYWDGVGVGEPFFNGSSAGCNANVSIQLSGETGSYNVVIRQGDGTVVRTYEGLTSNITVSGLCSSTDTYTVAIMDKYGCEKEFAFTVAPCELQVVLTGIAYTDNNRVSNGSLSVRALNAVGTPNYIWSTGATGSSISNLATGAYTVTVTDENGCFGVETFQVNECQTIRQVEDGSDFPTFEVIDNATDFEIALAGEIPGNGQTMLTRQILIREEGEAEFRPLTLAEVGTEYAIQWGGPVTYTPSSPLEVSIPAFYGNSPYYQLTVIVSNGCVEKQFTQNIIACNQLAEAPDPALAEAFISSVRRPCTSAGFADGYLEIILPYSAGVVPTLTIDGGQAVSPSRIENGLAFFEIDDLGAATYAISISFGEGCVAAFEYEMESEEEDLQFVEGRLEEEECVYERFCNDIPLGQVVLGAYRDYFNATSWRDCKIPVYCDDVNLGEKKIKRVRMSAAEYLNLLYSHLGGTNDDRIWFYINAIEANLQNDADYACSTVRVCPVNLSYRHNSGVPILLYSTFDEETGCNIIYCLTPPDPNPWSYQFCGTADFTAPRFMDFPILGNAHAGDTTSVQCSQYCIKNVFHMLYWMEWMKATGQAFPEEFGDSTRVGTLGYVLEHTAYRSNVTGAICANIRFCSTDYSNVEIFPVSNCYVNSVNLTSDTLLSNMNSVLRITDLATQLVTQNNYLLYQLPAGQQVVDFASVSQTLINQDPLDCRRGFNLESDGNPPPTVNDILEGDENEALARLDFIRDKGLVYPKGIIRAGGKTNYYDFTHANVPVHKLFDIGDLIASFEDWDTGRDLTLYRESENSIILHYQDSLRTWQKRLSSTGQMDGLDVYFQGDDVFVIGKSGSNLYMDDVQLLTNAGEQAYFVLSTTRSGDVLGFQSITGAKLDKENVRHTNGKINLLLGKTGDNIKINGSTVATESDARYVDLQLNDELNGGVTVKAAFRSNFALESIVSAVDASGSQRAYSLPVQQTGAGGFFTFREGNIFNAQSTSLQQRANESTILATDANGDISWTVAINESQGMIHRQNMAYADDGNLIVALTFEGHINIGNRHFIALGGTDILLLWFNEEGQLADNQQYGSPDEENVSELFVANGGVYLGGTFSGGTETRLIGNHLLVNHLDETSKAYIAYLQDEANNGQLLQNIPDNTPSGDDASLRDYVINAYPNPFNDVVNLDINAPEDNEVQVVVQDMLGRTVYSNIYAVAKGKNTLRLNLGGTPAGSLLTILVTVRNHEGRPLVKRVIQSN